MGVLNAGGRDLGLCIILKSTRGFSYVHGCTLVDARFCFCAHQTVRTVLGMRGVYAHPRGFHRSLGGAALDGGGE